MSQDELETTPEKRLDVDREEANLMIKAAVTDRACLVVVNRIAETLPGDLMWPR